MTAPLAGVRVLDLTRILAGPYCTMMMGDMGAEVIKVENPEGGDDTRAWPPFYGKGESSYFCAVNRNKKSLTLNLKAEEGKGILRDARREVGRPDPEFPPGGHRAAGVWVGVPAGASTPASSTPRFPATAKRDPPGTAPLMTSSSRPRGGS